MKFDFFDEMVESLNIDIPKNNSGLIENVFSTNYGKMKFINDTSSGILHNCAPDADKRLDYDVKRKSDFFYIKRGNTIDEKNFDWGCFNLYPGGAVNIYSRLYTVNNDVYFEEFNNSKEDAFILSIYKDAAQFLGKDIGSMTISHLNNIKNLFMGLCMVPDAFICVDYIQDQYKDGASKSKYHVRTYIDDMSINDDNPDFYPRENGLFYNNCTCFAQKKYNDFVKPLLDLDENERKASLATKI